MNSIVLWVGGLAALAFTVTSWSSPASYPMLAAAYMMLVMAASLSLPGHNDD